MELDITGKEDLGHRLLHWAEEHKNHLILVLIAGVGFFGLLAGITTWWNRQEDKAGEALYASQDKKADLEKILLDFPKSRTSLFAVMDLAHIALEGKDFDACIAQYEKLYDKAGREAFFRVFALHGLAECHKGRGDFKKAAESYDRAAKEPGHLAPSVSRFEEARCYQLASDPQAEARYQSLLNEKDLSPELKDKIEEQLLWLRLQKKS